MRTESGARGGDLLGILSSTLVLIKALIVSGRILQSKTTISGLIPLIDRSTYLSAISCLAVPSSVILSLGA